jgi:hypothetical protein
MRVLRPPLVPATLIVGLVAALAACPIMRPAIPNDYFEFREKLQEAVADTVVVEMRGMLVMQARLDSRLTDLAAILTADSLLVTLEADPTLRPLAYAVGATLEKTLESKDTGGSVRSAFRNPDGQRQAVDAMVIGLGTGLRRARAEEGGA